MRPCNLSFVLGDFNRWISTVASVNELVVSAANNRLVQMIGPNKCKNVKV